MHTYYIYYWQTTSNDSNSVFLYFTIYRRGVIIDARAVVALQCIDHGYEKPEMPESDGSSLGIRKTKTLKLEGEGCMKEEKDKVLSICRWCVQNIWELNPVSLLVFHSTDSTVGKIPHRSYSFAFIRLP